MIIDKVAPTPAAWVGRKMAVEQYGRRLLEECEEEGLDEVGRLVGCWKSFRSATLVTQDKDGTPLEWQPCSHGYTNVLERQTDEEQLLKDLRFRLKPEAKDVLGIAGLDRLFELFRTNRPKAVPAQSNRLFDDVEDDAASQEDFLSPPVPQRLPVIEVTSQASAAGKSTLLYCLAAKALLPFENGGKASVVTWFDTDGRFSASRLHQIMLQLVKKSSASSAESIALDALQYLYIFKPSTSTQLIDQLTSLPDRLLERGWDLRRPMSLLILDSATAFQHQDRFDAEMMRLEAGADYASRPKSPSRTSRIIAGLRIVQARFECTIAFSTQSTSPTQPQQTGTTGNRHGDSPAQQSAPHPPLPPQNAPTISPWTAFATLTLTTSRLPVSRFAPAMSLEECLRDRDKRQQAVAQGKFSVNVDWSSSERWPVGVREAVGTLDGKGRVGMVIREGEEVGGRSELVVEVG